MLQTTVVFGQVRGDDPSLPVFIQTFTQWNYGPINYRLVPGFLLVRQHDFHGHEAIAVQQFVPQVQQ